MKVLFVMPCYLPATRYGGPVKSVHELGVALRHEGVRVDVYATNIDGPRDLDVPLEIPVEQEGVAITYFQISRPRSYFRSSRLREALRRNVARYDLVYLPWMYADTTVFAAAECRRHHVPYVVSPRGMLDRNAIGQKGRLKKLAWLALLGGPLLRGAAAIHFSSRAEHANAYVSIPPERAFVVANGLRREEAALVPVERPTEAPVVLFLGRLSAVKGIDLLAGAWPMVNAQEPAARLVIAGPDDEGLYASMHTAFDRAGVLGTVDYVGLVAGAQKAALLRRADILVSPSHLESFGMAIVEAMQEGIPVVVTDRVNIAEDIAEAGAGLVAPLDVTDIAACVVTLLRDAERRKRMGARGRELARTRYAIESVAQEMKLAFSRLIAESKPAARGAVA